jgi:hypothetical protein
MAVLDTAPGAGVLLWLHNADKNRDQINVVDPATGQDIPGYAPLDATPYLLSADGGTLAAFESHGTSCEPSAGGSACYTSADALHLVDLASWHDTKSTLATTGWAGPGDFSPDAARLALVLNQGDASTLVVVDAGTGEALARRALPFRPSLLSYSQGGAALAIYGQPPGADPGMIQPDPPRVLLVDAASLADVWEQELADVVGGGWCKANCDASHEQRIFAYWQPAVVFSPDRRRLAIVHADADRLTTIDFDKRTVSSTAIVAARSWGERLLDIMAGVAEAKGGTDGAYKDAVMSPDGSRLYVIGRTTRAVPAADGFQQTDDISLGLQVVDMASGRIVASYPTEARWIAMAPEGAGVFLTDSDGQSWLTEVLDPMSARRVARLEKWEIVATRRIDGRPILVASQLSQQPARLAVLDPHSFEVVHSWSLPVEAWWVRNP